MQKSYYAIIPANVRYDEELTANAKLIYGEITALCNEKGFCWAGNSYFAELYKVSKKSISTWINQLVDKGYISTEIIYKDGSKEILHRYLRILHGGVEEIVNTPIEEKVKDNNTDLNNTTNNTKEYKPSSQIENLRQRYSQSQLKVIDDYLEMIRHTRVSAKIADSIVLGMYENWDKHPQICVEYGLRTHTENPSYHSRKENYTLGIIRNTTADEAFSKLNQKGGTQNGTIKSDYSGYDFGKERQLDF